MSFTPGPWYILPNPNQPRLVQVSKYPDCGPVLFVGIDSGFDDLNFANANLIAAAPEMYEALKMIRTMSSSADRVIAFGLLDEAIAKAEGKQP